MLPTNRLYYTSFRKIRLKTRERYFIAGALASGGILAVSGALYAYY